MLEKYFENVPSDTEYINNPHDPSEGWLIVDHNNRGKEGYHY